MSVVLERSPRQEVSSAREAVMMMMSGVLFLRRGGCGIAISGGALTTELAPRGVRASTDIRSTTGTVMFALITFLFLPQTVSHTYLFE